jgi:hypothetical protein
VQIWVGPTGRFGVSWVFLYFFYIFFLDTNESSVHCIAGSRYWLGLVGGRDARPGCRQWRPTWGDSTRHRKSTASHRWVVQELFPLVLPSSWDGASCKEGALHTTAMGVERALDKLSFLFWHTKKQVLLQREVKYNTSG